MGIRFAGVRSSVTLEVVTHRVLSPSELAGAVEELDGWSLIDDHLTTTVRAKDFSEAFGFMSRVALAAEKADHHPEWSNVWATVTISLRTHDADGITDLDLDLARHIDSIRPDRGADSEASP